jgi:hypothetical protein
MPRRRQKHSEADLTTYAKPRRGGLSPKAQREAAAKEAESTTPVMGRLDLESYASVALADAREGIARATAELTRQRGKSERMRAMWQSMANFVTFGVDVAAAPASGTVDIRIEQEDPLPLRNFVPAPRGEVTRRPGITHEQVNTVASTAVDEAADQSTGFTLDMIHRARELLERNNEPRGIAAPPPSRSGEAAAMYDRMREMGMSHRQAEEVVYLSARQMTASELRRHQRGEDRVRVTIDRRPDYGNAYQVRTRVRDAEYASLFEIRYGQDRIDTARMVAREHSRAFNGEFEEEILLELMRCLERAERESYRIDAVYAEAFRHNIRDRYHGFMNERQPELTGAIDWLKDFEHKEFELDGWKAKVLDTVEAVKDEGTNMQHCLGTSYVRRIHAGEYIAYHFTPPENKGFPKSGLTLGMHVRKDGRKCEFRYDQIKGKKNQTHYAQHPEVLALTSMIDGALNKRKGKAPKKEKEIQRINVDLRPGAVNIVNRALQYI